jgi:hypothetical protein
VLPQYGFLARVHTEEGTVEAAVEIRDGVVVESAHSPRQIYVNARGNRSAQALITPTATAFRATNGRELAVAVSWRAEDPIPAGYVPFYHFCDREGGIVFQGGADSLGPVRQGTIRTVVRASVPEDAKAGSSFELRAGLYDPKHGSRLELTVPGDSETRIRLGRLVVKPGGVLSWTPHPRPEHGTRENTSGKPVDFGPISTPGGVRLATERQSITVTPLPDAHGRRLQVRLRLSALAGSAIAPAYLEAVAENGRTIQREAIRVPGDMFSLICEPGVFQYRLTGE